MRKISIFMMGVLALGVLSRLHAAPPDLPPTLLDAVRDARSACLTATPVSGRGVAEVEAKIAQRDYNELTPIHRVKFAFDGEDALWKEYDPNDPTKITVACLLAKGRLIRYIVGDGHIPRAVSIQSMDNGVTLLDLVPRAWTFRELSRLPGAFRNEQEFFTKWAPSHYTEAKKDHSSVIATIDFGYQNGVPAKDNPGHINLQRTELTFDMAAGGLVGRYDFITDAGEKAEDRRDVYVMTTTWDRVGGNIVPRVREVSARFEMGFRDAGYSSSRVTFKEFTFGPLKPDELSVGQLEIPPGTPVVDRVRHEQYRYSESAVEKMLSTTPATSSPATSPATVPSGSR